MTIAFFSSPPYRSLAEKKMKTKQDKKQNKKQNQENETKKETAFGPFSTQVAANFARFAIFKESARYTIVPSTNYWNLVSNGFKAIDIYHLKGKLEIALMD